MNDGYLNFVSACNTDVSTNNHVTMAMDTPMSHILCKLVESVNVFFGITE